MYMHMKAILSNTSEQITTDMKNLCFHETLI